MASSNYHILGVSRNASDEQIRAAYLRLALTSHPDLNHGDRDAESRFKAIRLAYETLLDPDARRRYDLGIVEKTVVFSEGHCRTTPEAGEWPWHRDNDPDFDITTKQLNVGGRSKRRAAVAMTCAIIACTVLGLAWIEQSTNQSSSTGHDEANGAAIVSSRPNLVRRRNQRPDNAGAVASGHVCGDDDGSEQKSGNVTTDVIHPPLATLDLDSDEGESTDLAFSTSLLALGLSVFDPTTEPRETRDDRSQAITTHVSVEPSLAQSRSSESSPTILPSTLEKPPVVFEDRYAAPLVELAQTPDWQSSRPLATASLARSIDFALADNVQIPALADVILGEAILVDFSSPIIDAKPLLAAEKKGSSEPDWYSSSLLDPSAAPAMASLTGLDSLPPTPIMSTVMDSRSTLAPSMRLVRASASRNTSAKRKWHDAQHRVYSQFDPLVRSSRDFGLPSREWKLPLQQTAGGKLKSPPTHLQDFQRNTWGAADRITGPTRLDPAPGQPKLRHMNPAKPHSAQHSSAFPVTNAAAPAPVYPTVHSRLGFANTPGGTHLSPGPSSRTMTPPETNSMSTFPYLKPRNR